MELATLEELTRAEHEPGPRPTEAELIEAAKHEPDALSALYRLHHGAVSRYVMRRVGQANTAEDLVADVFLQMVRYLPKYRVGTTPFRAWLYRLATNRVNRWARWQRRRAWQVLHDIAQHDPAERRHDEAEHVRASLLTLPLHFQSVVALHYLEELSIAEIGQVLGCAEGTVKSRLARGRELLRSILTERDGDL
jgi:RNA polymerase sigma-70 factor (ECF subfamily)